MREEKSYHYGHFTPVTDRNKSCWSLKKVHSYRCDKNVTIGAKRLRINPNAGRSATCMSVWMRGGLKKW